MKLNTKSLIIIFLLTLTNFNNTFAADNNNLAKNEIRELVETFRLSIINKDKESFKSLFYSNDIPWIVVFSDEMLESRRKVKADFPRSVNFGKFGSPEKMISDTSRGLSKAFGNSFTTFSKPGIWA